MIVITWVSNMAMPDIQSIAWNILKNGNPPKGNNMSILTGLPVVVGYAWLRSKWVRKVTSAPLAWAWNKSWLSCKRRLRRNALSAVLSWWKASQTARVTPGFIVTIVWHVYPPVWT